MSNYTQSPTLLPIPTIALSGVFASLLVNASSTSHQLIFNPGLIRYLPTYLVFRSLSGTLTAATNVTVGEASLSYNNMISTYSINNLTSSNTCIVPIVAQSQTDFSSIYITLSNASGGASFIVDLMLCNVSFS